MFTKFSRKSTGHSKLTGTSAAHCTNNHKVVTDIHCSLHQFSQSPYVYQLLIHHYLRSSGAIYWLVFENVLDRSLPAKTSSFNLCPETMCMINKTILHRTEHNTNCAWICPKCEFFNVSHSFFGEQVNLETENRFVPLTKEKKDRSSPCGTNKSSFISGLKFISMNTNSIRG